MGERGWGTARRFGARAVSFQALCAVLVLAGACASMEPAAPVVGEVQVIQLNDVYEIFPVSVRTDGRERRRGGISHVATLAEQYRDRSDVLFLHAGDMFSPSLLSGKLGHRGAQMVAALNMLDLDAATFGNHEFDFGCRVFMDRVRESTFPWLAANVDLPPEAGLPGDKVRDFLVLVRGGLRVGIFGLALPIQPIAGCGPVPIMFRDPIAAARKAVDSLKRENVDVIVALTHLRMELDRDLARAVPEIDLIIGGHEHEVLETLVGKTLITKAGANALGLGVISLRAVRTAADPVIEKRWEWIPVDAEEIPGDPDVEERLAPYRAEIEPFGEVVGSSAASLDALEETVRERESNLGNLIADVMRRNTGADAALLNGGSIRDDRLIPAGPVSLGDIYTLLPFSNEIVVVDLNGKTLLEALENGVSLAGQKAGRFPQVSGLRFSFDPARPSGERVINVTISGRELDPNGRYTLAVTDFLVERGEIDGYRMLNVPVVKKAGDLNEAVIGYFRDNSPVCAVEEGRITVLGGKGAQGATCR